MEGWLNNQDGTGMARGKLDEEELGLTVLAWLLVISLTGTKSTTQQTNYFYSINPNWVSF